MQTTTPTTTAQHTPGPWDLSFVTERPIRQEVFGPDERIALVELPGNSRHDEQVANAKLIAAAPDLLEAIKALVEFADNGTPLHPGSLAWDDARAAIAKATC